MEFDESVEIIKKKIFLFFSDSQNGTIELYVILE